MGLTADERETVISYTDAEDVAHIYTSQRSVLGKLKRHPSAVLVEEGVFEGSPWARFEIDRRLVSFRRPRAKVALSEDERHERAERMRAVRAKASPRSKT